jgi:hypothetical protein
MLFFGRPKQPKLTAQISSVAGKLAVRAGHAATRVYFGHNSELDAMTIQEFGNCTVSTLTPFPKAKF